MSSFIETPRFPDDIAYGAAGGPQYSTDLVVTAGGYEKRNQNWSAARLKWDVGYSVRLQSQYDALLAFFHAVKGRAMGFRFKDHSDYAATASNGRVGAGAVGDGTPGPFQLIKRYTSGSTTTDRDISKPVSGSVTVYKGGVVQTPTTHYTLDTATGLVTWTALDSKAITGHTVGASHQFTTATDLPGLTIGEKVYLFGVTGTAAATLNGKAHTISNKAGAGPYTWTISTATTALTASDGTAYEYPQAADALTWAGEFDVPVRFDTDELRAQIVAGRAGERIFTVPTVPVVEIRV